MIVWLTIISLSLYLSIWKIFSQRDSLVSQAGMPIQRPESRFLFYLVLMLCFPATSDGQVLPQLYQSRDEIVNKPKIPISKRRQSLNQSELSMSDSWFLICARYCKAGCKSKSITRRESRRKSRHVSIDQRWRRNYIKFKYRRNT